MWFFMSANYEVPPPEEDEDVIVRAFTSAGSRDYPFSIRS